jgi:hypothetical protein
MLVRPLNVRACAKGVQFIALAAKTSISGEASRSAITQMLIVPAYDSAPITEVHPADEVQHREHLEHLRPGKVERPTGTGGLALVTSPADI